MSEGGLYHAYVTTIKIKKKNKILKIKNQITI
nr:MAG TPA: hypothetical protein [Crassvirales sp.]